LRRTGPFAVSDRAHSGRRSASACLYHECPYYWRILDPGSFSYSWFDPPAVRVYFECSLEGWPEILRFNWSPALTLSWFSRPNAPAARLSCRRVVAGFLPVRRFPVFPLIDAPPMRRARRLPTSARVPSLSPSRRRIGRKNPVSV